jgi:hypothetical protein
MEKEKAMIFSIFGDMNLKKQINEGKWRQDPAQKQKLLEKLEARRESFMEGLLREARSMDNPMVETAKVQASAIQTLAELGDLGAEWAFADKTYFDEELLKDLIAAVHFKPKTLKFDQPDLKVAAASLLIEIESRWNTGEFIPTILDALRDPKIDQVRKRRLYWRLEKLLDNPAIVNALVEMGKGPLRIPNTFSPSPKYVDGMGAYALVILLRNEVEKSYPALLENRLAELSSYSGEGDTFSPMPVGRNYFLEFVKPGSSMADLLIDELSSENPARQAFALDILGGIGETRALEPITQKAHRSGDRAVRLFAIQALVEINDDSVLSSLEKLTDDPDRKVRKAAQKAIKQMS